MNSRKKFIVLLCLGLLFLVSSSWAQHKPSTPQDDGEFTNSENVTFTWHPTPDFGPFDFYRYHLQVNYTESGLTDIKDYWVEKDTCFTDTNGSHSQTLYARVRIECYYLFIGWKYFTWSEWSDGITIDLTPPSTLPAPTDEGRYKCSNYVKISWNSSVDNESGIKEYLLEILFMPSQDSEVISVPGNILSINKYAPHGQTVYARVRAKNNAGDFAERWSWWSDGITVDTTPPSTTGTPTDEGEFTNSTDITFNWTKANDSESGIIDYHLQVGTTIGDSSIYNDWIGSNDTKKAIIGSHGQTLYAIVRAKNGAGSEGAWSASSDGITIDTTPPIVTSKPQDEGEFTSSPEVTFTWTPFIDVESGITAYNLQVGTAPISDSVKYDIWLGNNATTATVLGTHGTTLFARVRAQNGAELVSDWSEWSDGITIDLSPPSAPGTPIDDGEFTNSENITYNWTPADNGESHIIDYHLQVGTKPDSNDVYDNWIGNSDTTKTITGAHGQTLYAKVRAKNGAGLTGDWSASSDGITIDTSPPSVSGTPTDDGEYSSSTNVTFNWTPAVDNESGIINYYLQAGTAPGDSNIFNASVGNVLTKTVTGSANQTLYARVRAQNGAESFGEWSENSDGITIISVDVIFSFNLTSSMGDDIAEMKLAATTIINDIIAAGSDAALGVVSFVDYSGSYSSCDYSQQYGDEQAGDYPWKINQSLTTNTNAVTAIINGLNLYFGGDGPQDYSRALLECLFLEWRPDSRKFVVMIGDAPAHDCDFFSKSYGADPGPDAKINTCDDLNYEAVVNWVNKAGLTVISIDNGSGTGATADYDGDTWKNFEYMAIETGGAHFMKSNWHNIPLAVKELVEQGPKSITEYPWITEAEEMLNRIPWYGSPCEDGWRLTHQQQPIYESVVFLTDSSYHFTVTAKAEINGGAAPWVMVQIGDELKGTCEINSTEWQDYPFVFSISAGFHCLSLTYLNDWWNGYDDRNLLLDKVEIDYQIGPPPGTSYTFEAENMGCQHPKNYQDGDYMVLHRPYAYVGQDMFFEKPELTFEIFAKADFADGGWPQMELRMDDKIVGSIPVDNANPMSYLFNITDIAEGKNRVKIAYHTNSHAYQRNLYIDKLVIHTNDGGLLISLSESLNDEESIAAIPETFALNQNYPNPFNPDTFINYELPEDSYVVIKILNTLGQEVKILINEFNPAGYYTTYWDGQDNNGNQVVSGIYLYRIEAGSFVCTKKMVSLN